MLALVAGERSGSPQSVLDVVQPAAKSRASTTYTSARRRAVGRCSSVASREATASASPVSMCWPSTTARTFGYYPALARAPVPLREGAAREPADATVGE